jgi:hypothetical protein
MPPAKNHEENRKSVCCVCMKKSNDVLTKTVIERIQKYFQQDIDFKDSRVPSGICTACRMNLATVSNEGLEKSATPLYNFSSIILPIFLRSSPSSCTCTICKIARSFPTNNLGNLHPLSVEKKKRGRPGTLTKSPEEPQPPPQKTCPRCLSVVGPGKSHICTPSTLNKNIKTFVEEFPKGAEKIASAVIKSKEKSPGVNFTNFY